ncbi:hypothetical protein MXB_4521 [Myxobolus squamalis]|nr:hypothetical protein MXB_4521 [Myxobolus squamalis]
MEPSIKLLWQILHEIIKGDGCCNVADLCDLIFSYNDKLCLSSFLLHPQPSLNDEAHLKIVSSLLNHDLESVFSSAINSKNWALAFVLCFQNQNLQQKLVKKFVETLDSQDIIRSYISLQSNIPIDLSLMNIEETASNWNQHLALYLSQNLKNPNECSNYIQCISKILQSKSKWVESQICKIVLDLVLNHTEVDPPIFYPKYALCKYSLDLSLPDILHLRTMEMYEIVKNAKTSTYKLLSWFSL